MARRRVGARVRTKLSLTIKAITITNSARITVSYSAAALTTETEKCAKELSASGTTAKTEGN